VSTDATNLGRLRGANAVVRNGVALHRRAHQMVLHTIGIRTELLTAARASSNVPPSFLLSAQEDAPTDPPNGDLGADHTRDDHRRHCGSQSGRISCQMALDAVAERHLQTSHALHDIISSSMFVWRAVVQDLLLISPNSLLSRSLHVETPQMLRVKAIRFCNVQKTLSCDDPALLQSVSTLKLPMGHSSVHPCIVPGTPYVVYVSQNRTGEAHTHKCAIHLISMTTGHVHDTCHLRATSVMKMDVHHSATYGIVVVLRHFSKEGPRSL
jgi:hypothetical protein